MIKFYYNLAPNPTKVALCLEEMGLPYELVPVDTRKGDQHSRRSSPSIPTPRCPRSSTATPRCSTATRSCSISARRPASSCRASRRPTRGQMLSWLMFVASGIGPYSGQAVHFRNFAPEPKDYAVNRYTFEAKRHWKILDDQLGKSRYMLGDTYTHRRHGGVGLVAPGAVRAGPGRAAKSAQPEAPPRRDQRASRRGEARWR